VSLLTGISSIAIAAGFENKRDRVADRLKNYRDQLQMWQLKLARNNALI
jgi:hypothetical protein